MGFNGDTQNRRRYYPSAMPMFALVASLVAAVGAATAMAAGIGSAKAADPGGITFNRDLAPVIFSRCAPCHHPGGTGPFALLRYSDARKRAKEMAEVTANRVMPPWLPAPGHGELMDSRRMNEAEVRLFQLWLADGTLEGAAEKPPPVPIFPAGWRLGEPDLVVRMREPYELGPEGADIYRNFVVPLPLNSNRFVQAFEFRPGNPSVHHVRILLDHTGQCRRLDEQDPEPGFGGMNVPARFPPGQLLTWAPGRQPRRHAPELTWLLEADSDLVLQIHLQRSGKKETITSRAKSGSKRHFPTKPPARCCGFRVGISTGRKSIATNNRFPCRAEPVSNLRSATTIPRPTFAIQTTPRDASSSGRKAPMKWANSGSRSCPTTRMIWRSCNVKNGSWIHGRQPRSTKIFSRRTRTTPHLTWGWEKYWARWGRRPPPPGIFGLRWNSIPARPKPIIIWA